MNLKHLRDPDPVTRLTRLLDSYYRYQRRDLELLSDLDPAWAGDWAAKEYDRYQLKIRKIRLELQRLKEELG
jgi:hypothetical protein